MKPLGGGIVAFAATCVPKEHSASPSLPIAYIPYEMRLDRKDPGPTQGGAAW